MNQSQLARTIAKEFILSQVDAAAIINSVLIQIAASLKKGERVYFRNFGSFTKKIRPGRHVRHPKTGQLIWVPPWPDVDFNPAKGLLPAKQSGGAASGGKAKRRRRSLRRKKNR